MTGRSSDWCSCNSTDDQGEPFPRCKWFTSKLACNKNEAGKLQMSSINTFH